MIVPFLRGKIVETKLCVLSKRRMVFHSLVVTAGFELLVNPRQQVIGQHADEDVRIDAFFELMVIWAQAQRAF